VVEQRKTKHFMKEACPLKTTGRRFSVTPELMFMSGLGGYSPCCRSSMP